MATPAVKNSQSRPAVNVSQWASNFFFAGSSALLLLVSNFFPDYWYLSFFALIPFLYKVIKAAPRAALCLGLLFGLAFFSISLLDSFLSAPLSAIFKLGSGVALFAFFGWVVGWAKDRWGFNPLTVALLWVGLELGLVKLGFVAGFLDTQPLTDLSTFFHGLAVLFGFLAVSFVIVLFNSLLILAAEKAVSLAQAGGAARPEDERFYDFLLLKQLLAQKVYLVPKGRAPPLFSLNLI